MFRDLQSRTLVGRCHRDRDVPRVHAATGQNRGCLKLPRYTLAWMIASLFVLLLAVLGCQISPRRIVTGNGPTPTPIPTETPTPTPGTTPGPTPVPTPVFPTPTPTPAGFVTPTPTPMAGEVPKKNPPGQFLFATSPDARLINGFRINPDGSLAPVSGSPFVTRTPLRSLTSVQSALIAADGDTIFAFAVDKESGAIRQTDALKTASITKLTRGRSANVVVATTSAGRFAFRIANGKVEALPEELAMPETGSVKTELSHLAALDASGRFMYVADGSKAELSAFQVDHGKLVALSPPSYPVTRGTAAIALVQR